MVTTPSAAWGAAVVVQTEPWLEGLPSGVPLTLEGALALSSAEMVVHDRAREARPPRPRRACPAHGAFQIGSSKWSGAPPCLSIDTAPSRCLHAPTPSSGSLGLGPRSRRS